MPPVRASRRLSPQAWAEETIRAIRAGEVDAFVMAGGGGERTVAIADEQHPYRLLMERMNEGAVTLTADGTVLYCNRRLAEIVRRPHSRVLGASLREFVATDDRARLDDLLTRAARSRISAEFAFQRRRGAPIPVALSLGPASPGPRRRGTTNVSRTRIVGVVTDVTERREQARRRNRLYQRLMVAADQERRSIARELHDETGQSLTALLVGLRGLTDAPTLKEARASARRLRELAARSLEDIGRLARGLHPSVLDELGLVSAVTRQIDDFKQQFGLVVTLQTKGLEDQSLPLPLATTVYRLIQESLTNVARHAHARTAHIALRARLGHLVLQVRDDGLGFDPQRALAPRARSDRGMHLGLLGMRERTAWFGGALEIRSTAGKGTTIIARLPIAGSAPRSGRRARAPRA